MPYFDFKQFRICHDRCTMKVGTDGVLLGAWAEVAGARRILDIGTGSGLIALMAAQRSRAAVTGVELHSPSALQAAENAAASPFSKRVSIVCTDIRDFSPPALFDCILSNPPFYEETLLPPDPDRACARHTQSLSFEQLIVHACRLLSAGGLFQVVIPHPARTRFVGLCALHGLSLLRATEVVTGPRKQPKRILLRFVHDLTPTHPLTDRLVLTGPDGKRSPQYAELTRDFYL